MTIRHMTWKTIRLSANTLPPYYRGEYKLYRIFHPTIKQDWRAFHELSDRLPKDWVYRDDFDAAQSYIDDITNQEWYKKAFVSNDSRLSPEEQTRIQTDYVDDPRVRVIKHPGGFVSHDLFARRGIYYDGAKTPHGSDPLEMDETTGKPIRSRRIYVTPPHSSHNNRILLLHELAHLKYYDEDDDHGPGFRGAHLHLVHHALGPQYAQALAAGYKNQHLDWNFDAIRPDEHIKELTYDPNKKYE